MLTWKPLGFFLFNALLLNGVLLLTSPPGFNETVLKHTQDTLNARNLYDDSWGAMGQALDYLQSPHKTSVYTEVFFRLGRKFQYPVSSLLPFAAVRSYLDLVSIGFLLLTILATAGLLEVLLRESGMISHVGGTVIGRAALVAAFSLTFYPIVKAFTLGQIQVWINALFAVSLLCWVTDRRASAGILIGLISLIKPHYGLFLLWAGLRREWRFAVTVTATCLVGLAVSVATFGWANHVDYLRVLTFLSQHGESFHPNQSVNGLLNRLMGIHYPNLYDNVRSDLYFPPYSPWVYAGTLISSIAILLPALFKRRSEADSGRVFDFCIVAVSCTIASPIAWEHHYGILLPVFVVVFTSALQDRSRMIWVAVSYVLASNYFQIANLLAPTILNVVQSYLFAAAVIVLVLLYRTPEETAARTGTPIA